MLDNGKPQPAVLKGVRHAQNQTAPGLGRKSTGSPCPRRKAFVRRKDKYRGFLGRTRRFGGYIDLLVDNSGRAKGILQQDGLSCTEHDVLRVELSNVPGALAVFTGKLAEKNINIGWGYSVVPEGSRRAGVILAVSDIDKAVRIR